MKLIFLINLKNSKSSQSEMTKSKKSKIEYNIQQNRDQRSIFSFQESPEFLNDLLQTDRFNNEDRLNFNMLISDDEL